ncbi:bifunctional UDP-N-acetylglucosamine diphosphorylase/glucosamine-1-phosphate N-acetyltransferase GlmU [Brachybacterium sp. J144]|uniref:bifunctional UDP-N-acetylglucosamine diphosphorylase/glucosamine-1-phosphate N-acetyltransferase GlmU n=1 Tax=Brachybacterium sp. J144 TaxID=3116487 RepID=UPI002E7A3AD4|nr:bifunctional UDP-N-acetylglucosamine diphosphorylase/glucosamine-1-phosphate N-acetyltransferase GlmU [Brachybacterium sp. J144]MEE1649489.1 bifunctional UDP-N-acetylglucosamine diphosphorylase/glucosamine-1-phosphate N-acetyltransferase GlmU [Brachybacterium sp. J144]
MEASAPAAVIVLAAGAGTRMKSRTPKVLHEIGGRSLLAHAVIAAEGTGPAELVVVVRHEREKVAAHLSEHAPEVAIADQDDVPGTGRAVQCGLEKVAADSGTVLVTYGDVPLLEAATLRELVTAHEAASAAVTVLTARVGDPTGYGRILRSADGSEVLGIVEHKDATEAQRAIDEINSGIYAFDLAVLRDALSRVSTDNAQGEMYLTDVLEIARSDGRSVRAVVTDDVMMVEGANDRVQLAQLGAEMNRRTLERHMRAGVTIIDPATTWIDADVTIGQDARILPGVQLHGATDIGEGAIIGPDTTLRDTEVGAGAEVLRSHALLAQIGAGATVGPFSYLRAGTELGANGKIGGFVETKNARIGDGAKVPHLSYVGDAEIGEGTNIGAATIFANYDGVSKHRTTVGKHVRIGSDNVLVAPVTIGDGAATGAGTTVRKDVPPGALGVNAVAQRNVEGWTLRRRAGTAAEAAARAALEADPAAAAAPAVEDNEEHQQR